MAVTIKQSEDAPANYPPTPPGLSSAAVALSAAVIWQRLENYLAYRWTARAVTWIVEGPGEWHPPLTPAAVSTVEVWSRGAAEWDTAVLDASALGGYCLPLHRPVSLHRHGRRRHCAGSGE